MKLPKGYVKEEEVLITTTYCRLCGEKLISKTRWDTVKYDEYTGDKLLFKYLACPDIEKAAWDNNNRPVNHSHTYSITRKKK